MSDATEDSAESGWAWLFGLFMMWAVYLLFGAVSAVVTGDPSVFVFAGLVIPGVLLFAVIFGAVAVFVFLWAMTALTGRLQRTVEQSDLDLCRLHSRGWFARFKGSIKIGNWRRTAWGFLVDAALGLVAGLGFGLVLCSPFVLSLMMSGHLLEGMVGWSPGFGCLLAVTGCCGMVYGLASRMASQPLLVLARERATTLPPPVEDEYF